MTPAATLFWNCNQALAPPKSAYTVYIYIYIYLLVTAVLYKSHNLGCFDYFNISDEELSSSV